MGCHAFAININASTHQVNGPSQYRTMKVNYSYSVKCCSAPFTYTNITEKSIPIRLLFSGPKPKHSDHTELIVIH